MVTVNIWIKVSICVWLVGRSIGVNLCCPACEKKKDFHWKFSVFFSSFSKNKTKGLNKYNGHHKRDKYGGKSGNHKDYNDHHVYQRNRGYGYEKHFVYDKEYSTGKSSGTKNGHHSYYGDHDHGSKSTMDMHKNYDSKKYGTKIESNDPHLIIDNDHYDDHGHGHGHSSHYPSLDLNKMNLLKHKKELLKKHLDHQHYYHNGHHNGHHQPTIHHTYSKIHDHLPGGYSGGNSYSTHLTPFLGQTYHSGSSLLSPNSYDQQQYSGYIPQQTIGGYYDNNHPDYLDNLYLSSSSNNAKKLQNTNSTLINTDTEGESINTLLPPGSNSGIGSMPSSSSLPSTTSSMVNMAPLISTRLSSLSAEPIEMMMIKPQQSGPEPRITTVAESFARIQNAVHATPPIISTHHYRQQI